MDNITALPIAAAHFESVTALVTSEDLAKPTPCGDWTVQQLLDHVVGGNTMSAALMGGASREDAIALLTTAVVGANRLGAVQDSMRAQSAAFSDPAALELIVQHPAMDMPGAQLLGFRVGDLLVHSWDLARAIGADETLDPEVVAVVATNIEPMRPFIGQVGMFGEGPSETLDDNADAQTALLDLMGRRP
ncbi:MAG: TIGR03086 family metal-binding protein [Actinobacteria bacterium]|nr:TIGR03086 family metal-binding protein [Actinomycetota bacterium]